MRVYLTLTPSGPSSSTSCPDGLQFALGSGLRYVPDCECQPSAPAAIVDKARSAAVAIVQPASQCRRQAFRPNHHPPIQSQHHVVAFYAVGLLALNRSNRFLSHYQTLNPMSRASSTSSVCVPSPSSYQPSSCSSACASASPLDQTGPLTLHHRCPYCHCLSCVKSPAP